MGQPNTSPPNCSVQWSMSRFKVREQLVKSRERIYCEGIYSRSGQFSLNAQFCRTVGNYYHGCEYKIKLGQVIGKKLRSGVDYQTLLTRPGQRYQSPHMREFYRSVGNWRTYVDFPNFSSLFAISTAVSLSFSLYFTFYLTLFYLLTLAVKEHLHMHSAQSIRNSRFPF